MTITRPRPRAPSPLRNKAEYPTIDLCLISRIQSLQFAPYVDRTAATQTYVNFVRGALSGIFMLLTPRGLAFDSPAWVPGRHAPLLKMTKSAILAYRDDTHDLHRLVDEFFAQVQGRLTSGFTGPSMTNTMQSYAL